MINNNNQTATFDSAPIASSSKGTIAVDMDDVLCQTNETIVHMHNENFGVQPPLALEDFKNYLYWKNRGWGTPSETVNMVAKLYAQGLYMKAPPIPGAKEGLLKLKEMGYNLIIITARSEKQREGTEDWIAMYLPDIFDEIHFTGAFQHLEPTVEEQEGHVAKRAVVSHRKRSKAEIVHSTSSLFLIDDSSENALDAATASPPVRVLLFGDYPWNAIVPGPKPGQEGRSHAFLPSLSDPNPNYGSTTPTSTNKSPDRNDTNGPGSASACTDTEGEGGGGGGSPSAAGKNELERVQVPSPEDEWTYAQLESQGLLDKMEDRRRALIAEEWLPDGVERVKDWDGVVKCIEAFERMMSRE